MQMNQQTERQICALYRYEVGQKGGLGVVLLVMAFAAMAVCFGAYVLGISGGIAEGLRGAF